MSYVLLLFGKPGPCRIITCFEETRLAALISGPYIWIQLLVVLRGGSP